MRLSFFGLPDETATKRRKPATHTQKIFYVSSYPRRKHSVTNFENRHAQKQIEPKRISKSQENAPAGRNNDPIGDEGPNCPRSAAVICRKYEGIARPANIRFPAAQTNRAAHEIKNAGIVHDTIGNVRLYEKKGQAHSTAAKRRISRKLSEPPIESIGHRARKNAATDCGVYSLEEKIHLALDAKIKTARIAFPPYERRNVVPARQSGIAPGRVFIRHSLNKRRINAVFQFEKRKTQNQKMTDRIRPIFLLGQNPPTGRNDKATVEQGRSLSLQ